MRFNQETARMICPPTCSRKPGSIRQVFASLLLLLLAALAGPLELRAGSGLQREYEIKAAYLYNFINYIDWPAGAFPAAGGVITIGIIGENPFGGALEPLTGKPVKGCTLVLKQITDPKEMDHCQILFISASEKQRVPELLDLLKDSRILTVSEVDGFAARGGIINFISERNKVRFEINPNAARRIGLTISSELLKLAKLVKS